MIITDRVRDLCKSTVEGLGYELVEVTYSKGEDAMDLTLYINKDAGITLGDCEKVSKAVDPLIEESEVMGDDSYNLNVSSLGVDWPEGKDKKW